MDTMISHQGSSVMGKATPNAIMYGLYTSLGKSREMIRKERKGRKKSLLIMLMLSVMIYAAILAYHVSLLTFQSSSLVLQKAHECYQEA